jgi:D-alanyl-D-alanine dipeptidase/carboxypeptidase
MKHLTQWKLQQQQWIYRTQDDIHAGHLILVNRNYPVKQQAHQQALEQQCARQLFALLTSCKAMDTIVVVSGYRSIEEQQSIYESSLLANGAEFTASYVARPGESEHQTGLAVDVGERSEHVDFICPSFPDQGACLHFKQQASAYGFIQRYQEGKQHLTNIACEPWHYRYVGVPHANIMDQLGLCLEEYTEYVKPYSYENPYHNKGHATSNAAIYYVQAEPEGMTKIPIVAEGQYQVSGNNIDGFVVTIWSERGSDPDVC